VVAGVEVHANVLHMLVTRRFINPLSFPAAAVVQMLVAVPAAIVIVAARPVITTLVLLGGAPLLGLLVSYWTLDQAAYWIDFTVPVAGTKLTATLTSRLRERRVREKMGRYLSPQVADHLVNDTGALGSTRLDVSVLFSDLRNFTALAEHLAPEDIAARLTEYFDVMTDAIFEQGGMINDFVGDAIMAVFGAPLPDPQHASHAIAAAKAMELGLARLNETWRTRGIAPLKMGIGIHSGTVFAGDVGTRTRAKYSLVGDTVNVASRVEGLNRDMGTAILITDATRASAGLVDGVVDRGKVTMKGRSQPVQVFELVTALSGKS
jgi:adenylate cyclase